MTEYSEHYLDSAVDCFCQVRQDKRAAKEKRREEARMREVSSVILYFLKHWLPFFFHFLFENNEGGEQFKILLSLAFFGGEHSNIAFRIFFASCSSLLGCF